MSLSDLEHLLENLRAAAEIRRVADELARKDITVLASEQGLYLSRSRS